MAATYVYIMECDGFYKIGVATNISSRLSGIQTGSPHPVTLCGSRKFSKRSDAVSMEKALHKQFEEDKVRGEWFAVPLENLLEALKISDPRKIPPKAEILRCYKKIRAKTGEFLVLDWNNIKCLMTRGCGVSKRMRSFLGLGYPLGKNWKKKLIGRKVDRHKFIENCDPALEFWCKSPEDLPLPKLKMPFGKYKEKFIEDIPRQYLEWFYQNVTFGNSDKIKDYLVRYCLIRDHIIKKCDK